MDQPKLYAIGTANPAHKISQQAHYAILEHANGLSREEKLMLRSIYAHSGIEYRHSVLGEFSHPDDAANKVFHPSGNYDNADVSKRMELYEQHAAHLCCEAARNCLEQLVSFDKRSITHVISFSCTGMYAPGIDIQVVERLGLNRNIERTCINFMGCYAAINAIKTAYHIARSQPQAVIMLAGVELCSLHYQKNNHPNQLVANALFSDGAAVAIVSAASLRTKNAVTFCLKDFYAEFEHSASGDMVWRIGNSGFDLRLTPEVPHIVRDNIVPLIEKLFDKAGLTQEQIDHYAIHPGGVKILEACEQALGIKKTQNEIAYQVLNRYGNMSSVTILFVLQEYMQLLTAVNAGEKLLACAFGPGITMESMIIEICS